MDTYNGHASYEHWNASLWIYNDEPMYNYAMLCLECCDTVYDAVIQFKQRYTCTPDGVEFTYPILDDIFREEKEG
jgi:hypothetical protein